MFERLFSLKGKVALITGGSRGIGRAIAFAFAEAGADLVVSSRNKRPPELEKVAEEIQAKGGKALAIPAHVGKKEDVQTVVQKTLKEYGRIDVLVNNAGANPVLSTLVDLEEEAFEKVLEVNLKGAFLMSKAVAKEMIKQGGGRIINISSISGLRARADGTGAYCISKAAMNMMTQVMARELAQYHILVNAIAPGSIKTEFSRVNWMDPERRAQRIREIELKRFGEPEEVVGLALFLASEASSFVTGEIIRVDGGQTI
ncbi:MAG: SDR family oxidoreductase [Thermodesulfobacteriota bacterium]|jgi:NAD(P)-dependent dehydrogenase (short-subunit alcohol dehydrogenase family)